jgi:phospholipid/cholesterol/gamma-HCH transport system substrate-binding protein
MLTVGTKIKLIAFGVLAVLILAFTAVKYAALGRFIGVSGYYTVTMNLPNAGGLFSSADVTYRGVSVGRVGSLGLTSTGIVVSLDISDTAPKIPSNVQATVADLSAVGEEYVNLSPRTNGGPYLTTGSVIREPNTQLPPSITSVLTSVNSLVSSVPQQSLRTLVSQLGSAFQGQGPNLQVLLDNSDTLTHAATEDIPQTTTLITDGQTVLATQASDSSAIESFGQSADLLASQLDSSNSDLEQLITNTPEAAIQVADLLRDNDIGLGAVIANLLTTSDVALTRQPALEEMMSALPAAVAAGSTVINAHGANFGLALTFFNPYPCVTGYGGTIYRNGLDTSPSPPLNTNASCTLPPSSGTDVRGPANAPSGGPVPPAVPNASAAGLNSSAVNSSAVNSTSSSALPSESTDIAQLLGLQP